MSSDLVNVFVSKLEPRENYKKREAQFDELPLCELRERYWTEEGKAFLDSIIKSSCPRSELLKSSVNRCCRSSGQEGRASPSPQARSLDVRICGLRSTKFKNNPEARLYKVPARAQLTQGDMKKAKQSTRAGGHDSP